MTSLDDELNTAIRRNMLLGLWAAEKLGLVGPGADAYAKDLAVGTLDAERSDVFSKIRKDSISQVWSSPTSRSCA